MHSKFIDRLEVHNKLWKHKQNRDASIVRRQLPCCKCGKSNTRKRWPGAGGNMEDTTIKAIAECIKKYDCKYKRGGSRCIKGHHGRYCKQCFIKVSCKLIRLRFRIAVLNERKRIIDAALHTLKDFESELK